MSPRRAFEDTTVPANKTKGEVRDLLAKYGVQQFGIIEEPCRALIGFTHRGRTVKIEVPLPDKGLRATSKSGGYLAPGSPAALKAHEQEERRIWRAVRAWVFAQLEAVESGIVTFESVWLPWTVLVNGETFSEWAEPQIEREVQSGRMPHLLSGTALERRALEGTLSEY